MPAHPETPEPLKGALERMEALVQSFKSSIAFAAPEAQSLHYGTLQTNLADVLIDLYTDLNETEEL